MNKKLIFILCLYISVLNTSKVTACFNPFRPQGVSVSSSSATGGSYGPGGSHGQFVSVGTQCINGNCQHHQQQETWG